MKLHISVLLVALGLASYVAHAEVMYSMTYLAPGGATDINNKGQIVGTFGAQSRGFLYSNGVMTDLGNFGPAAINDSGQVAGTSFLQTNAGFEVEAFLYSGGVLQGLGNLGTAYSRAAGINNSGQVVGDSLLFSPPGSPQVARAFVYSGGVMVNTGLNGTAYDINERGQIVGMADDRAFVLSAGVLTQFDTLGGRYSRAFTVNNSGVVSRTVS